MAYHDCETIIRIEEKRYLFVSRTETMPDYIHSNVHVVKKWSQKIQYKFEMSSHSGFPQRAMNFFFIYGLYCSLFNFNAMVYVLLFILNKSSASIIKKNEMIVINNRDLNFG